LFIPLSVLSIFFFKLYRSHQALHSFPTRRSSDLITFNMAGQLYVALTGLEFVRCHLVHIYQDVFPFHLDPKHSLRNLRRGSRWKDRKSTRLNSSHGSISYAVFCLKKKKKKRKPTM